MIYSLLIIAFLGTAIAVYRKWRSLPEESKGMFARQILIWVTVISLIVLVITGRGHWLMGVLAALLALASKVAQLAQYIPLFKKLFGEVPNDSAQTPSTSKVMSRRDAADILGVDIDASDEDVRAAHKRLMQKIHPDRGGSDALAKQINNAKRVLLED